jgi:hypothetical protein
MPFSNEASTLLVRWKWDINGRQRQSSTGPDNRLLDTDSLGLSRGSENHRPQEPHFLSTIHTALSSNKTS